LGPRARISFFFVSGVSTCDGPVVARSAVLVDVDVADAVLVVSVAPAAPIAPAAVFTAVSIVPVVAVPAGGA